MTSQPPKTPLPTPAPATLIPSVTTYVRTYMSRYDPSHDFTHVQRVVRLARYIHSQESPSPATNLEVVTLAALLHDVGDRKYVSPDEDPAHMVRDVLVGFGAGHDLAARVQAICGGVSYSAEVGDPERVGALVGEFPELAVVQDADRLDAIGAIGVGRCFAFGAAKRNRPLEDSIQHFDDKLVKIHAMMKTETGKRLAKDRTDRILKFKQWWTEETKGPAEESSQMGDPLGVYDNWESI